MKSFASVLCIVLLATAALAEEREQAKKIAAELPYGEQSTFLAGALSLVVPGAGQVYNGQHTVGGIILGLDLACYLSAFGYAGAFSPGERFEWREEAAVMLVVAVAIHVFAVYDAITEASRMNAALERFAFAFDPHDSMVSLGYRMKF